MAVIESKGDGYALYNGVKLPSLPEITNEWLEEHDFGTPEEWDLTEFPEFKYSVIFDPYGEGTIFAFISARQFNVDFDGYTTGLWLDESEDVFYDIILFELEDGNWRFQQAEPSIWWEFSKLLWSNYELINIIDNSTYFTGSDPIPLDGMNVIEWDGDTTGLEYFPDDVDAYLVSNANVDVTKGIRTVRHNLSTGKVSTLSKISEYDIGVYENTGGYIVTVATEQFPDVGVYLISNSKYRSSIFAYYPIEEEPETTEPIGFIEYLVNPKYRRYLFRGFFGWQWARNNAGGE